MTKFMPLFLLTFTSFAKADYLQVRNLKNVACEILIKTIKYDMDNKYELYKVGLYVGSKNELAKYNKLIKDWQKICISLPIDKIERNEPETDITYLDKP